MSNANATNMHKGVETETPWKDPNAVPFIRFSNVVKKFGEFVAVDNINLDIYRSELFCLLGGSGSGKSTLLRMMAGFEDVTSGSIFLDGVDMADIPPYKRPINMMFQSYALFPHLSVESNIAFGLKQDKIPRGEIKDQVAEMLELVQMSDFAKRKPHQLSGGQRQRVALARSLIKRPKLLLLDEPLGALDKKLREKTQFELINIQERLGITFMVVTHDQEEAMTLATRIGVMDKGQIVQVGEPKDIYEFPASRFVANFIGDVNLFEGRISVDEHDHVQVRSKDLDQEIYFGHGVSCTLDQKVSVAIRPEKVRVHKVDEIDLSDREFNYVKGKVEEIAYMGDISVYHIKIDSGKIVKATVPNLSRWNEDNANVTWNEQVVLTWGKESAVLLVS